MTHTDHMTPDQTDAQRSRDADSLRSEQRFGFLDQHNPRYAVPAWATLDGLARPATECGLSSLRRGRRLSAVARGTAKAAVAFALLGQVAYASQDAFPALASLFC
jgi:hypothetical protein